MRILAKTLIVVLPLSLATTSFAQHQAFTVNPDTSTVNFTLSASDHTVEGTFHVKAGSIDFDRSAGNISGSVVVAAASGNSGNKSRDGKMNKDVLDAANFAEISFVPRSYQGTIAATGDSSIQVTGTFNLHGAAHELTVPMQLHFAGNALTTKTHFSVPYVQWGLKDPSFMMFKVAKEVGIDLTLAGQVSASK
jgi:polyisoprenoid-binding protein YceI